jgi:hypothetical protein
MCSEPATRAPVQRAGLGVLAAQLHQAGHLVLGQPDLLAAELGQTQVGDGEVDAVQVLQPAGRIGRSLVGSSGHQVVTPPR